MQTLFEISDQPAFRDGARAERAARNIRDLAKTAATRVERVLADKNLSAEGKRGKIAEAQRAVLQAAYGVLGDKGFHSARHRGLAALRASALPTPTDPIAALRAFRTIDQLRAMPPDQLAVAVQSKEARTALTVFATQIDREFIQRAASNLIDLEQIARAELDEAAPGVGKALDEAEQQIDDAVRVATQIMGRARFGQPLDLDAPLDSNNVALYQQDLARRFANAEWVAEKDIVVQHDRAQLLPEAVPA